MTVTLPLLSFLCAACLAAFIPIPRVYRSVSSLAIIIWLLALNLIQGVNTVVYSGNVDVKHPVWCDIGTRVVLGANIAIPGAFLSLARHLELVGSRRPISTNPTVIRNRMFFELVLCYVLPMLYMTLHMVAQSNRFDLVRDYGCFASIQASSSAAAIVRFPPLILCILTLALCIICVHHACRQDPSGFAEHLSRRGVPRSSVYHRKLTITIAMSVAYGMITLFAFFASPAGAQWGSWAQTHEHWGEVNVIEEGGAVKFKAFLWWGGFAITVLYLVLMCGFGEEVRDCAKVVREKYEERVRARRFMLPVVAVPLGDSTNSMYTLDTSSHTGSIVSSTKKKGLRPLTLELKSGWDDTLDFKKNASRGSKSPSPSQSSRCPSPLTPTTPPNTTVAALQSPPVAYMPPSTPKSGTKISPAPAPAPSSSSSHSSQDADEAFMASTLSYLGSPQARTLGIANPNPTDSAYGGLGTVPVSTPTLTTPMAITPKRTSSIYAQVLTPLDTNVSSIAGPSSGVSVGMPGTPSSRSRSRLGSRSGSPESRSVKSNTGPMSPSMKKDKEKEKEKEIKDVLDASLWPVPPASPTPSLTRNRSQQYSPVHVHVRRVSPESGSSSSSPPVAGPSTPTQAQTRPRSRSRSGSSVSSHGHYTGSGSGSGSGVRSPANVSLQRPTTSPVTVSSQPRVKYARPFEGSSIPTNTTIRIVGAHGSNGSADSTTSSLNLRHGASPSASSSPVPLKGILKNKKSSGSLSVTGSLKSLRRSWSRDGLSGGGASGSTSGGSGMGGDVIHMTVVQETV